METTGCKPYLQYAYCGATGDSTPRDSPFISTRKNTDPTGSLITQNEGSSTIPGMPILFGDLTLDTSQDGISACKDSNGDSFVATYNPRETVETNAACLMDIGRVGKRTCSENSYGMSVCLTEPCSDTVAMLTFDRPFVTPTEVSGSFLEAWQ